LVLVLLLPSICRQNQALNNAVLVGGAVRMPFIGRVVKACTGVTPRRTVKIALRVSFASYHGISTSFFFKEQLLGDNEQIRAPFLLSLFRSLFFPCTSSTFDFR
jgi:hypothetical protein